MTTEPLIALEIHDASLWEPSRVLPIIDTMQKWGYNALVLHQNDLLDACTQLGLTANYGVSDLRLKKVRNNAAWLNRLTERLGKFGAKLFLEIKEPSIHDYVLEFYPDLIDSNGQLDPTSPLWLDVCRNKTSDLLSRVPDLGGLIVNISSPESRISLPDYLATNKIDFDPGEWFDGMIAAFHEPLKKQGKELYVRDFSYTADMQSEVLAAINRTKGAVSACVKITAHDYFPEFPENPVARLVENNLILEFEAFGEHMGWGVIPNCRVGEFCQRMFGYREMAANGFLMRTSWEAITGTNALDSLSAVNVYSLPKLIQNHVDPEVLVLEWLKETYDAPDAAARKVCELLLESWKIPAGVYWDGQVFPRHSCLPSTWQEGWMSKVTNGMGRRNKDIAINADNDEFSETARSRLFAEKETVSALASELAEQAAVLSRELPSALGKQLEAFAWLPHYAKQFELATKATFYAARASKEDLEQLSELRGALLEVADDIERKLKAAGTLPHHHRVLFDPDQIRLFVRSLPN